MTVQWCAWDKLVNKSFLPYVQDNSRYQIYYGGRGSSKSYFVADKLIYKCLTDKYFRFILIRNTYSTIKDSSYQTLKDRIYELGLGELFDFKLQPLEIICKNGNKFLARGCDDTTKLKSIKDPTGAWYEEDIPEESDFITITTSIRTAKADSLQEIFTINPEVDGDFKDNWFWKRFFEGYSEKTFRNEAQKYTVMHSTYLDNRWATIDLVQNLHNLAKQDPYYYTIYCLGEWGNRITGGNFYKMFNRGTNVSQTTYNEHLPIHVSFDFNVNPYMSATIWQISNNIIYNIGEIAAKSPKNTTKGICFEFKKMFPRHLNGVFVYGDPAGRSQDTRTEHGANDFTIIMQELEAYRPSLRVHTSAPSIHMRGQWINAVFSGLRKLTLIIGEQSPMLLTDLMNLKEDGSGDKYKQLTKDKVTGVTYEKYGHMSDTLDYMLTHAFSGDYQDFQKGGKQTVRLGSRHISEGHSY